MKEQFKTIILPKLPIVGQLKILTTTSDIIFTINIIANEPQTPDTDFSIRCYREFQSYLCGQSQKINLPSMIYQKSEFQIKILNEINKISYGEKKTYKEIGEPINSRAYQAIGSVCRTNPLILLYPCHRVIGKKNSLQYIGGEIMKKNLQHLESSNL